MGRDGADAPLDLHRVLRQWPSRNRIEVELGLKVLLLRMGRKLRHVSVERLRSGQFARSFVDIAGIVGRGRPDGCAWRCRCVFMFALRLVDLIPISCACSGKLVLPASLLFPPMRSMGWLL